MSPCIYFRVMVYGSQQVHGEPAFTSMSVGSGRKRFRPNHVHTNPSIMEAFRQVADAEHRLSTSMSALRIAMHANMPSEDVETPLKLSTEVQSNIDLHPPKMKRASLVLQVLPRRHGAFGVTECMAQKHKPPLSKRRCAGLVGNVWFCARLRQ